MLSKERSKVKMQSVAPIYRAQLGLQLPESAQVLIQCYRHSFGVCFFLHQCFVVFSSGLEAPKIWRFQVNLIFLSTDIQ